MASIGINAGFAIASSVAGVRFDPYKAYHFLVEIDGILAGGFTDVSGLSITTDVESIREGGLNTHVHKLPKFTTQTDLVLKKGQTDIDLLWNWYVNVTQGDIERKNGSIYLLDDRGLPAMWWDFIEAYPISWAGPTFNSQANTVATESLTLVHHGLIKSGASQIVSGIRAAVGISGF